MLFHVFLSVSKSHQKTKANKVLINLSTLFDYPTLSVAPEPIVTHRGPNSLKLHKSIRLLITIGEMTVFNVKGVACSNEPTKNYHLTLQFLITLCGVLAYFRSLFWFNGTLLCIYGSVSTYFPSVKTELKENELQINSTVVPSLLNDKFGKHVL